MGTGEYQIRFLKSCWTYLVNPTYQLNEILRDFLRKKILRDFLQEENLEDLLKHENLRNIL